MGKMNLEAQRGKVTYPMLHSCCGSTGRGLSRFGPSLGWEAAICDRGRHCLADDSRGRRVLFSSVYTRARPDVRLGDPWA